MDKQAHTRIYKIEIERDLTKLKTDEELCIVGEIAARVYGEMGWSISNGWGHTFVNINDKLPQGYRGHFSKGEDMLIIKKD